MVTTPSVVDVSARQPRPFGGLLEASFKLALAAYRPLFWLCFWLNLVAQLPMLWWWWRTRAVFAGSDWRVWLDASALLWDASDAWVTAAASVMSLLFSCAVMYRMAHLVRGDDEVKPLSPRERGDGALADSLTKSVRMLPGSLALAAIYIGLMALCLVPVAAVWWLVPGGETLDALLPRLVAVLFALLIVAAPLAWVSIAAVFALPAFWLDGEGIIAAQVRSFRLVRGHWTRNASVMTTTMLAWLGIISIVGMIPLAVTGAIAVAFDGVIALAKPGWLVWGQLLSTPLLALFTPLCFAGWLVCYEDLRLRQG